MVAIFFVSCEKNLELEIEEKGGQLVLYSFIAPDSLFQVHLSKSVSHISVDDFERVYHGNVTIYKNDEIVDDFIYPFDKTWAQREDAGFKAGDRVIIEAADGKGQRVRGEALIPEAVPLVFADTLRVTRESTRNGDKELMNCQFSINDPGTTKNYYQLIILEEICHLENGLMKCERNRIEYSKNDPVFYIQDKQESLIGSIDFDGCFSDTLFNGSAYSLEVDLPIEYFAQPEKPQSTRKIYFLLLSHQKVFYDYFRSRVVAEYGYDLPIIDPIRIYNNVQGGLGVVAGYNVAIDSLIIDNGYLN